MPILKVLLGIPEHIQRGLDKEELVRDAAGIIRWARGTPQGGNIVAHLHEVGEVTAERATSIIPSAALGLLQIASVAYLARRLDRLESAVRDVLVEVVTVRKDIELILHYQSLEWTREVARGAEFLVRGMDEHDQHLVMEARHSFIRAGADARHWLTMRDGESLLEQRQVFELVLRADACGLGGERTCMCMLNVPYEKQATVLRQHREVWARTKSEIEAVPPATVRIPSKRALDQHGRALAQWRRSVVADLHHGALVLESQERLCLALASTSSKARRRLTTALRSGRASTIAVVPEEVLQQASHVGPRSRRASAAGAP